MGSEQADGIGVGAHPDARAVRVFGVARVGRRELCAAGDAGCLTATGEWQQWPAATLTPAAGHQLDAYTITVNAQAGDSYELDGLTLTGG